MLRQFTRFAKNLLSRLSSAANQHFRPIAESACPNVVTDTLADLPCRRVELRAENALLRQQLIVLSRRTKTPRLTWRKLFVPVVPGALMIVGAGLSTAGRLKVFNHLSAASDIRASHAHKNRAGNESRNLPVRTEQ